MTDPVTAATSAKLAGTAASGVVATVLTQAVAAASVAEPEPSLWTLAVLGIPLGMFGANLVASLLRTFRDPPLPEEKLAWRLFGVVSDAAIGGWLAVFVMGLPATREHIGNAIHPAAVGAVFTLVFQFLRNRLPKWLDSIMGESIKSIAQALADILKSWLAKRGVP